MLKKLTLIFGMLAAAAGTAFATNVVVLDLNRVIESFSKTAAIKAEVESDQKSAEEIMKIKVDEFKKLREKFEAAVAEVKTAKNNPTLGAAAVKKAEAEAESLYADVAKAEQSLRQSQQEAREILQSKFTQKTNVVLQEDILPRIKEIAKAHGAEVVLNARVGIIFSESSVDVTDELLARLEKDFPAAEKKAE